MRVLFGMFVLMAGSLGLGLMFHAGHTANLGLFVIAIVLAVVVWTVLMLWRVMGIEQRFSDTRRKFRHVLKRLHEVYGSSFATSETIFFLQATNSWGKKRYRLECHAKQPPVDITSEQEVTIDYFIDSPMMIHVIYEAHVLSALYIFREKRLCAIVTVAPPVPAFSRRATENELLDLAQQLERVLPESKD